MTEVAAESTAVSRTGSTTLVKTVTETYDYVYNGGRLSQVKKTTSTTTSSGTTNATDTLNFTYDANGTPMAVKYNNTNYYYVTNLQGDVTAILNTSGTAVASYTYDAWGNILTTTGSMASTLGTLTPLRYRGYIYDTETGFYYVSSRYYDPEISRFINADNINLLGANGDFASLNLFAYCGNNPVTRKDASGYAWETIWDAISLASSIVEVAANPYDPWAWIGLAGDVADVLIPFVGGIGETTRALKAASKATGFIDTASDVKKGWKIGDDITSLTKAGNVPSWSTLRSRYWKNKAYYFASEYSEENVSRMMRGLAPQIIDQGKECAMELHHIRGRKGNYFYFFFEISPADHAIIDPYRFL